LSDILLGIILGVVQGVTEFLPISSSGHLIVVSWLLDGKPLPIELNIALHVGTLAAILFYFRADWFLLTKDSLALARGKALPKTSRNLILALIIGTIPAGIVGVLFEKDIEAVFHHPVSVAIPLMIVGWLIWWSDVKSPQKRSLKELTWKDGLIVGLAQATALIPGTSRSGITICASRWLSFDRATAARFSFLLGMPAMAGAVVLNAKEVLHGLSNPVFYVGAITAAIVGCLSIKILLAFLQRYGLLAFAIYRTILAAIIILIAL
jgi:undecaprenyl-diphosphatase